MRIRLTYLWPVLGLLLSACAASPPPAAPRPAAPVANDPERDQRAARLEVRLLAEDAQVQDLQARLDSARQEVVRAMAKLQTLASRADAASGMAEAEIALQALKTRAGQEGAADVAQAGQLLKMSGAEFNNQNYGGALYLANEAKSLAAARRGKVPSEGGDREALRAGEVLFAAPMRLRALRSGNVREGPGTGFKVAYRLDAGAAIVGYSYADVWVRVSDEDGRSGWIFYNLVGKR